jgi:hypothetical protein
VTKILESLADTLVACPADGAADGDPAHDGRDVDASTYRPFPHQARFHEETSRYKAAIGGLGMGKTAMGTMEALYHSWQYLGDTPHVGIVGAPTYPMIRDVIVPSFRKFWPKELLRGGSWDAAYMRSEMVLHTSLGSAILFRSLDAGRYERLRGVEDCAWLWFDEACLLADREAWLVGIGRLRHKSARVRTAWITTTPRGEDWVARDFVLEPRQGYACVRGTTLDNKALPADYVESLRQNLSPEQFRQEALGEIVAPEGAVYKALSRQPWPDGNVLIPSPTHHMGQARIAVDFGRENPRAIVVRRMHVSNPSGRGMSWLDVVVDEWREPDGRPPRDHLIEDMISGVRALGHPIELIHGDPAGDSRNDHEHMTSAQRLASGLGVPFLPPPSTLRGKRQGEELVAGRIRNAAGERRLVWLGTGKRDAAGGCVAVAENSLRAHLQLQYPARKLGSQSAATESLKDGVNDHDTDAVRYDQVAEHGAPKLSASTFAAGRVAGA